MQVREAKIEDAQAITMVLAELRGEKQAVVEIERQMTLFGKDDNRTILLVVNDKQLAGVAVVNLLFKLPKIEARIDEVIISKDARGKGYGSMLIEACETWAWDHGADVIELTSRPSREAANAMYQKLGYQLRETNVYNKKR